MRYCEKCKVRVLGSVRACPLCQNTLTGTADEAENTFPVIPFSARARWIPLRVLMLLSVAVAAACAAVLLCRPEYAWIALAVLAGTACAWIAVAIAIRKRGKPLKAVLWQACAASLLVPAWDLAVGFEGWSLDYVLPILYICAMISMPVIAWVTHLQPQDYLLYLTLDVLLGLVPLLLMLCGLLRVRWPSAVCSAASVVFLAGLILFEGRAFREELARRLHL